MRVSTVTGIYLFEAKSIQAYLSRSGRLKNVVEASDALANLIDDSQNSDLRKVMKAADLLNHSDLDDPEHSKGITGRNGISFFRTKGGAFYCWSDKPELLYKLRSFWLLYFQESFPGMVFNDALVEGDKNFGDLLDDAFKKLQTGNNILQVAFPMAGAIAQSTPRTGSPAVASDGKDYQDLCMVRMSDIDSQDLKLNLYNRTIDNSEEVVADPETLRETFERTSNSAYDNDIALIHLDGNGMGQTLMALKDAMRDQSAEKYTEEMRKFSGMLERVTGESVKAAMYPILKESNKLGINLICRPLVIGGDDVTLLLEPCYAYKFAVNFCREFKTRSEKEIKDNQELMRAMKEAGLPLYLTASGGILFNKKSHPFFNSSRLVEGLAEMAKSLTKHKPDYETYKEKAEQELLEKLYDRDDKGKAENRRLYSAVAVFRTSSAETGNVSSLVKASHICGNICTGASVYFVSNDEFSDDLKNKVLTISDIMEAVTETDELHLSKLMSRMRRITGHMMTGDSGEWKRELALMRSGFENDSRQNDDAGKFIARIENLTDKIVYAWDRLNRSEEGSNNYIKKFVRSTGVNGSGGNGKCYSIFDDLILAHHYINRKYEPDSNAGLYTPDSGKENE